MIGPWSRPTVVQMPPNLRLAPALSDDGQASDPDPIRVVLADDHNTMRRNLRRLLDAEEGVTVVAEATDLEAVSRHVHGHLPHVLVLDLHLPNGSAMATIRELRSMLPETQIVVLTMEASPALAKQALAAGALGYVLKEHADRDLVCAVRNANRGDTYVTPQVAAGLEALQAAADADRLTARETEVLRLTALGYTGSEIAKTLHISRRTVDTHRASLHHKLGVETRAELVSYALGRHLIGS